MWPRGAWRGSEPRRRRWRRSRPAAHCCLDFAGRAGKLDPMSDLFRFPSAVRRDPRVEAWFAEPDHEMRRMAQPWFERMRACGADVRELLHDRCPWACVEDAAFGYVNAFNAHVNIGFLEGAS